MFRVSYLDARGRCITDKHQTLPRWKKGITIPPPWPSTRIKPLICQDCSMSHYQKSSNLQYEKKMTSQSDRRYYHLAYFKSQGTIPFGSFPLVTCSFLATKIGDLAQPKRASMDTVKEAFYFVRIYGCPHSHWRTGLCLRQSPSREVDTSKLPLNN